MTKVRRTPVSERGEPAGSGLPVLLGACAAWCYPSTFAGLKLPSRLARVYFELDIAVLLVWAVPSARDRVLGRLPLTAWFALPALLLPAVRRARRP
jgi:hypothetical protein